MTSESPRRVRLITRREQIDSRRVEETRTSWNGTGTPASVINAFMKIDGLVDCLWADKEISPGHVLRPFIQHVSLRRKRISGNHYLFIETLLSFSTRYLIFFIYLFLFLLQRYNISKLWKNQSERTLSIISDWIK